MGVAAVVVLLLGPRGAAAFWAFARARRRRRPTARWRARGLELRGGPAWLVQSASVCRARTRARLAARAGGMRRCGAWAADVCGSASGGSPAGLVRDGRRGGAGTTGRDDRASRHRDSRIDTAEEPAGCGGLSDDDDGRSRCRGFRSFLSVVRKSRYNNSRAGRGRVNDACCEVVRKREKGEREGLGGDERQYARARSHEVTRRHRARARAPPPARPSRRLACRRAPAHLKGKKDLHALLSWAERTGEGGGGI